MSAEKHIVYAYLETGVKVRISSDLSWSAAVKLWYILDDVRFNIVTAGLSKRRVLDPDAPTAYVGDYIGPVKFYAVRSADDPNWPSGQWAKTVRHTD